MVVATQNPVEMEGTYPLPEAQRDRFMARVSIGYPSAGGRAADARRARRRSPRSTTCSRSPTPHDIVKLIDAVRTVHVAAAVRRYAVDLVGATRNHPDLRLGASPRATLHLLRAARAAAALDGREYVLPDDVQALAVAGAGAPAAAHRPGAVEPPHRRAGRRGDPRAHARTGPLPRQTEAWREGPGSVGPNPRATATAGHRRPARRWAHRVRGSPPSGAAEGGLRPALAGLTTRGRSFLAAGIAAVRLRVSCWARPTCCGSGCCSPALPLVCAAVLYRTRYRVAGSRRLDPVAGAGGLARPGCICGWTTSRGCPPAC